MLSFGLLDVLAVVFAFIPLYGVDDGSFVRMANLVDYGASVDFGASFAVMATAVVLFASTMQPYATTLMFALLLAKVVVGYRILRS